MITRRQWLQASSVMISAVALGSRSTLAQASVKNIKVAIGQKTVAPNLVNLLIGEVLGYNAAEGIRAEFLMVGGVSNAQVAIDKGDVDIATGVPSFALPILARGEWGKATHFYQYTYPYKWDVAVKPDSTTKSYQELKGKNIGVSDFAGTEYPVTRNVLRNLGIDPDHDVKWTAVGGGVTAGVALQRGAIDALAYYDTGFGQIEGAGIDFKLLPLPKDLPMVGGQFLMALRERFAKDRDLLVGYGRSVAKASVFLMASPRAGARAFLKMYPEAAPRASSEEDAIKAVLAATARRIKLYDPPYAGAKLGSINPDEFRIEAQMNNMKIGGLDDFYTNALIDEINQFDREEIRRQALSYA
jgi:NitT/TauT family transport system substrate-binding protein